MGKNSKCYEAFLIPTFLFMILLKELIPFLHFFKANLTAFSFLVSFNRNVPSHLNYIEKVLRLSPRVKKSKGY